MNNVLILVIFAVASYLFGNVNWAIIISKIKKSDIRKLGSGNPGTLNMSRNLGLGLGLLTFFLDIMKGVVPTLIYYGLKIINPSIFLLIVFLFTGVISLMAGSSWTTIGTIGVAMISTGEILGFHTGWLAGAIISGAYLGDKLSPLSDTTNLAASISGVDLYKHIKYMAITNIPAFLLVGVIFSVAGFFIPTNTVLDVEQQP